jgi:DNA-binding transcriptional LysR family regulator
VRRLAQNLRRAPGHSLRIGATPALALSLLPPAIHEWTTRYPDIACELSSAHSRELTQNLLMREIDVALTLQLPDHPGLKAEALASGVLVALAPKGYWPEEDAGKPLPLLALAGAPLIGLSSADPAGRTARQLSGNRRTATARAYRRADVFPRAGDG